MANFSIKCPLFIVPFDDDEEEKGKIDFFLRILDESGISDFFTGWRSNPCSPGHPEYNPEMLFAASLLCFAIDGGRLRGIEERCRFDLRFVYMMSQQKPSYATFCNFLNQCVLPNADAIFSKITACICSKMGIDPVGDVFVDGTKFEANANKYKFVWKPDRKMEKLLNKAVSECKESGIDTTFGEQSQYVTDMSLLVSRLSEKLAAEGRNVSEIKSGKGIRNTELEKTYLHCMGYLAKMEEYQEQTDICGPRRNSYYKTDHDATAMCLKEDYYSGLGSNMHAGYNVQASASKGIVLSYYVSQDRADYNTLPTFMEVHKMMYGSYPRAVCADAGYGGIQNYSFLKRNGIGNYVKTNTWEGEASGKRPAYYRIDENGEIVCLSGRKAVRKEMPSRHPKKPNSDFYEIKSCRNCQYSLYCKKNLKKKRRNRIFEINREFLEEKKKAFDNLLSPRGIEMRINRSIQIEGTFGIIKQDMRYERIRRCGMKKVGMEIMMTFLGLNIRKYIRFVTTGKNPDYWKAPEELKAETFKPISRAVKKGGMKKTKTQPNEKARKTYKRRK